MHRLFSLEEARALLPRVRAITAAMHDRKVEFDRHRSAYELLAPRTGDGDHVQGALERHRATLERLAGEIQLDIEELNTLGIEVKGIDEGLVDFPSERDGQLVYLCWRLGETDIGYWHDLTTGFRGRRPL